MDIYSLSLFVHDVHRWEYYIKKTKDSRTNILKAAIREFGKKGYKEASTNDISKACGSSKGLLFYYFKSKEQLFIDSADYCISQFDSYMQKKFTKRESLLKGLEECCWLRKRYFISHPDYHHIFCEVLYGLDHFNNPRHPKLMEKYKEHSRQMIIKILEGVSLNPKFERNECIQCAVIMLEAIDAEIWSKYQKGQTEEMLEEQMRLYRQYFELLMTGILRD